MITISSLNGEMEVTIAKDGAELVSVKSGAYEYMWQANPKYWGRTAPVLFPIVGRLLSDKYEYKNETYTLNQHGFARDLTFEVKERTETSVVFMLKSNNETLSKYPFAFELLIGYEINEKELKVSYEVRNKSDDKMYYQIGGHPAFNLDLDQEYTVEVSGKQDFYDLTGAYVNNLKHNVPTNYNVDVKTFENGALIFKPQEDAHEITIKENGTDYVKMRFDDFKLMGVWTPEGQNAPFLCLEPWNGVADFARRSDNKLENKDYINELAKNATDKMAYTIIFS